VTPSHAAPLLAELSARAMAEAEAARATARAEADRIVRDARAQATREADRARAALDAELARENAQRAADANRHAQARLLPERAAAAERVMRAALERIEAWDATAVGGALDVLVGRAVAYLPDGGLRARCRASLVAVVTRALSHAGRAGVDVMPDDTVPVGAILETTDGTVVVDATFAGLLARDRRAIIAGLAGKLPGADA
jgi:vacuolar-type H+-ATPase subunit E/Vma4